MLDKLTVEELPASSRRYPYVGFTPDREVGKEILTVEGLSKTLDGEVMFEDISFRVERTDKIAFISENELAVTALFEILMGNSEPDSGAFKWGISTSQSYFPRITAHILTAVNFLFSIGFVNMQRITNAPKLI